MAFFYDSDKWTMGEHRDSTSVQRRRIKCLAIPELYSGEDSADEGPAMWHKSKRTVDVACCHGHLYLGCVMMGQNFVSAEVICARGMMGGEDWAGTATA